MKHNILIYIFVRLIDKNFINERFLELLSLRCTPINGLHKGRIRIFTKTIQNYYANKYFHLFLLSKHNDVKHVFATPL